MAERDFKAEYSRLLADLREDRRRANKEELASAPSWFEVPPFPLRHEAHGRQRWKPDHALIAFGMYVKRARYLAGMTQRELSRRAEVDQGLLSRLERALAPATKVEKLVLLSGVLGRNLPLGYCPHDHGCPWQPAPAPPLVDPIDRLSPAMRAIAARLGQKQDGLPFDLDDDDAD